MPSFYLTRRAANDLRAIHSRSCREWGEDTAARYVNDMYLAMHKIAHNPKMGLVHKQRAMPFMIVAVRKHFIVYDCISTGIIILTVVHQMRDIETIIASLTSSFLAEIANLRTI
jgi:toxin ParE1/3/4